MPLQLSASLNLTGSLNLSGSMSATQILDITSSNSTNALTSSTLVSGNSYTLNNLTASNISASGTGSFNMVTIGSIPSGVTTSMFSVRNNNSDIHVRFSAGNTANYTANLYLGTDTRDWQIQALSSSNSYNLSFNYAGTNAPTSSIFVLTPTGRIGIGSATPVNKLDVVGNISCSVITASLFSGSLSGSVFGTSSWSNNAISSSYALSASYSLSSSYAPTNITASWSTNSLTASYVVTSQTASYYNGSVISSSYSLSSSFAPTNTNITASWSTNALTASYVSSSGPTDIWISAGEMIPRSFSGSGVNSLETSTNRVNYDVLEFDAAIDEYAQVTRMLPNNWNGGTVTAKFVWTATTGSGNVVWGLRGRCYSDNTAIDSALGTFQTVTDTLQTASYIHITNPTSAITITGSLSVGQPIIFELYRFATTGSDTLAVDAQLLGMQINYN